MKIKEDYYEGKESFWGGINVREARVGKLVQAKRYLEYLPKTKVRKAWIEIFTLEIGKRLNN